MSRDPRERSVELLLLSIPTGLLATLRADARAADLPLNDYCACKLAAPQGASTAARDAARVVERAAEVCVDRLAGVVAYGSWARGETRDGSDVDVLIVLAHGSSPSRSLYRVWDAEPLTWDGCAVEPHFVRLPEESEPVSGLWAEVAIDGIVLFERGRQVSTHLVHVRNALADGRLVRRFVHGQPYWVEIA